MNFLWFEHFEYIQIFVVQQLDEKSGFFSRQNSTRSFNAFLCSFQAVRNFDSHFVHSRPGGLPSRHRPKKLPYGEFLSPSEVTSLVLKSGICVQKLESKNFELFLRIMRHNRVGTSFWCNFSHFWTVFLHFWCAFRVFCGGWNQATPNRPIEILHYEDFYCMVRMSTWLRNLEFAPKNWCAIFACLGPYFRTFHAHFLILRPVWNQTNSWSPDKNSPYYDFYRVVLIQ